MSSKASDYQAYIERLGLTEEQGQELMGALQCIIESLLTKKYMLEPKDGAKLG